MKTIFKIKFLVKSILNDTGRHNKVQTALQDGLQARGCPLRGIWATPDLAAHMQRFTCNGWQRAEARDMSAIHRGCLDPGEKRR